jgi:hypothetical protein
MPALQASEPMERTSRVEAVGQVRFDTPPWGTETNAGQL